MSVDACSIQLSESEAMIAEFLSLSEEVIGAVSARAPVVAIETSALRHILPFPQNLDLSAMVAQAVRIGGAIPAFIHIEYGKFRIETIVTHLTDR